MRRSIALVCLGFLAATPLHAQTPKDQLQQKLNDVATPGWVYDDIDAGFAEAKKTGKPLLVVFR